MGLGCTGRNWEVTGGHWGVLGAIRRLEGTGRELGGYGRGNWENWDKLGGETGSTRTNWEEICLYFKGL